ncbi:MAG: histone deacetylase [Spirochaetes bacterium]|jgi:acetoin utilization deacetylase AcuC-like enzyme|nr:histone deacetylase [Spirochaetota bacterium]
MRHIDIIYDELCKRHDNGSHHPERPERLDAVRRAIDTFSQPEALSEREPEDAPLEAITRVHDPAYVERVAQTAGQDRTVFDMDTSANQDSYAAALRAAGGALAMTDAAVGAAHGDTGSDHTVPFALLRPPGHHAEHDHPMGFCFFNNVAIAAAHAIHHHGLSRVAVVDWDVHHGNGTQHLFEADPSVLYLSAHEYPLFPGTGGLEEVGRGDAAGYTVNVPLPAGQYDAQYVGVFRRIFEPIVMSFEPELILVSAGFDAHTNDPLANMELTAAGFGVLTQIVMEWAHTTSGGNIGFVLEGGYNLGALTDSIGEVMACIIDQERHDEDDAYGARLTRAHSSIAQAKSVHESYWPAIHGG